MRDLDLKGLSEDGRFLVARDVTTGETYRIPADHRLSSLIGKPSLPGSTSGQMEIRMQSSLSPRDIQTRIRRGESPQSVADSAGVPVDQISGFALGLMKWQAAGTGDLWISPTSIWGSAVGRQAGTAGTITDKGALILRSA